MKKMLNKVVALALAVCMICSFGILSASAAAAYPDGTYTATARILNAGNMPDMLDSYMDHQADVVVTGGTAAVKLYFVYPVPGCKPTECQGGTVTDLVLTVNGKQVNAVSDITTKPLRALDMTTPMFDAQVGTPLPAQIMTVTVPVADLDSMVNAPLTCTINHAGLTASKVHLSLTELIPAPQENSKQSTQLKASIEAPAAEYSVVIPEVIDMGALSKEADNVSEYTVDVTAQNLGEKGYVQITAPTDGYLHNEAGSHDLYYMNSFGTQSTRTSATLTGAFKIYGGSVKVAPAGNYTGTVDFAISYNSGR